MLCARSRQVCHCTCVVRVHREFEDPSQCAHEMQAAAAIAVVKICGWAAIVNLDDHRIRVQMQGQQDRREAVFDGVGDELTGN